LKIALVRKRFTLYGGAERYTADLAIRLAQAGHEVHLFSHRWPEAVGLSNLRIRSVPMIRGQGLLEILSFYRNVDRLLERESFDIIQSSEKNRIQDLFHGDDGCHREWLTQRRRYESLGSRLGMTINPFHRITLALERRLFERGSTRFFIAISHKGAEEVCRHYPPAAKKIRVIYNALDLSPAPGPKPKDPDSRGRSNILFVGSGFFRKGLFFLIRALPLLQKKGEVVLTVVGRDRSAAVMRWAEQLKVAGRIRFVGPVNDPRPYYQEADLLVLPSIYEPFGNVVLEAMAYGLPVVVSRQVGAAEWIRPGINGSVVSEPNDPEELAEAVYQALQLDPRTVREYDQAILPSFSWGRHLQSLVALYDEIKKEKQG
jgi:UDP-glucose:(heptosyl)LPS alpha-1,3-glucosyltransferase